MRVALFGCGRIGTVHAESVAEHPRAELAWVCDPMEAAAAEIASLSPVVMVGFNRRFDRSFREIRDRVRAGDIGRLELVAITSRDPAPPPREYIPASGGLFRDMTIHDFDMARFLLGDVVEVQAMGANLIEPFIEEAGDIDSAVVVLRSADGALAHITNSRRCSFGHDQRVEAFGSSGMLTAHNQLPTSVRHASADHSEAASPYLAFFRERYGATYPAELDHFVTSVESGTPPSLLRRRPRGPGPGRRRQREPPHRPRRPGALAAREISVGVGPVPLAEVELAWPRAGSDRRVVVVP
jgi:predicted dehydrogenase